MNLLESESYIKKIKIREKGVWKAEEKVCSPILVAYFLLREWSLAYPPCVATT